MKNEITFLFGSGISFPTEMISSKEILYELLESKWKGLGCDGYAKDPQSEKIQWQKIIEYIFNELKSACEGNEFLKSEDKIVNYEDVSSVLTQLLEYYNGYRNIPSVPFLEKVWNEIEKNYGPHGSLNQYSGCTLRSTKEFIDWVVITLLSKTKSGNNVTKDIIKGFSLFDELAEAKTISDVTIFTLNHDLLIEKYLGEQLDTPFEKLTKYYSIFNKDSFNNLKKFHLYKLHGSINWKPATTKNCSDYHCDAAISFNFGNDQLNTHSIQTPDSSCTRIKACSSKPLILTGSFVKDYSYNHGIFFDLFHIFHEKIYKTKTLFVSGYGWNDIGINRRILHYLEYMADTKLVIFDKNLPESYSSCDRKGLPGFLCHRLGEWVGNGKIVLKDKWFSECTIEDINTFIA